MSLWGGGRRRVHTEDDTNLLLVNLNALDERSDDIPTRLPIGCVQSIGNTPCELVEATRTVSPPALLALSSELQVAFRAMGLHLPTIWQQGRVGVCGQEEQRDPFTRNREARRMRGKAI